jgi:hypothetical protein
MFRKILYGEIVSFIFVLMVGTLLHFAYQWSMENRLIATFSPVNESTWEHLKILFMPMFLFTIFEYLIVGRKYHNFYMAKAIGTIIGIYLITSLYYTYIGILGYHILVIDIVIFILSVLISHIITYYVIKNFNLYGSFSKWFSFITFLLLFVLFVTFTFFTPHINFFLDPKTETYGI